MRPLSASLLGSEIPSNSLVPKETIENEINDCRARASESVELRHQSLLLNMDFVWLEGHYWITLCGLKTSFHVGDKRQSQASVCLD